MLRLSALRLRGLARREGFAYGAVVRCVGNAKDKVLDDELKEFMHGRGHQERRDSVTNYILLERQRHIDRIRRLPVNEPLAREFGKLGLGDKRRKHQVYASVKSHVFQPPKSLWFGGGSDELAEHRKTRAGAGGFAIHLTSATRDWPVFKHMLPEIAFAGHSNSGKVRDEPLRWVGIITLQL
jgi:hypothetical protein